MTRRPTLSLVAAGLAAAVLAGCTGTDPDPDPAGEAEEQVPVIAPGRPGEPAGTADPDHRVPVPQPNEADFDFVEGMIPHHRQALEMAALVEGRSSDAQVQGIAGRIAAGQQPEIDVMESWLGDQGVPVPDGTHHGHSDATLMPGMATPEQLAALTAASGPAFDQLFLELMIRHHQGAITMATEVLASGADLTVARLAQEVFATQNAEISRMQAMLDG